MNKILLITLLVTVICCLSNAQQYSKFDNVNVDTVLKNDRILTNYLKCLLDKGPCTQEGRELKKTLADAIRTDCNKCSTKQRENTNKVIKYLRERKPREWEQLIRKYDPNGLFQKRYAGKL